MGLLSDIKEIFEVDCLYEVFDVEKTATTNDIKKAYRKKSLMCHPDKAPAEKKDEFTRKFQTLCKTYDLLQDEERRKVYDETGDVDDEAIDSNRNWDTYWRNLFPKVTLKCVDDFLKKYIGSELERKDLKKYYERFKGDMNKISQCHIGYSLDNEDRLCSLLREMIESEEIKDYPAFSKETAASKRKRRENLEKEAEEVASNKARSTEPENDELSMMILGNQRKRASDADKFIADLEAKYSSKKRTKSKK
ncbi:dnaJ homolog subfamily C member 9 [Galendromus occidentalis]|uniref:DnaJ homolog subfamily C member 9 n=1 Tax=Galendromus occidentalis TaxID=34638 RepID=A0AAJ6QUM5_9ACAR|nr:dnaJ homolog subfamily C member 9 [Galendromus occidentalis]